MTRSTLLKLLAWLAILPAALYLLYFLTANILLNSNWARSQLDRSPRFELSWERAWSLFPGQLHVTELTLAGTAAERRYRLEADSATLGFELIPLLQQRIRISDLDADGIRQAELDGYRLEGQGTLRLHNLQWQAGELAVGQLALALSDGQLLHGATTLVEDVTLHSELQLDPLRLADHPGRAAAQFVSGTLELVGHSDAYDVFNPYLATLGWLRIGGHGELQGELAIQQGEVQPGSHLRLDSPTLSARLDEGHWLEGGTLYHVHGSGTVAVNVTEHARLALTLNDIEIVDLGAGGPAAPPPPLAHAEEFRIELTTPDLQLHAPPDTLLGASLHLDQAEVTDISVLDPFLADLFDGNGLAVTGGGRITGTLYFHQDELQAGSRLEVQSEALGAELFGFRARGDGQLQLAMQPHTPEAKLALEFAAVEVTRLADLSQLLQAEQLALTTLLPTHLLADMAPQGQLVWRNARVPDVSVLNTYLPAPIPLRLLSGAARSDGEFTLTDELSHGQLTLRGSTIDGQLLNETFRGELDATLVLREYQYAEQSLDLSGSRLEVTASTAQDDPLHTLLVARQARLQGFDWLEDGTIHDASASQSLGATLQLDGMVDRLSFLNAFLPKEHGLAIQGGGRLSAELRLTQGELAPGSQVHVHSQQLGARFLHYEALGDGSLVLEITDPGARLHLTLPRFSLRRQAAEDALIEGQLLEIHSQAQHFALPEGLRRLNTEIAMPHVAVPSLAALNDYLPQGGGVELLSGQASIATHLHLEGMSAEGTLSLHAPHARLAFDKQTLDGELRLESHLRDGDLETLSFDISGSQLSMRNVHLQHNADNLAHGWWAQLALPEGRMRWKAPLELDARLELAMRDSGLLVNLFVDAVRERRWLRDRLTLGEVLGEARVILNGNTIRVEDLAVYGGSRLELLANLALRDSHVLGRAFARYGPLRLGIEMDGEERRWQWRNAREWYFAGRPASELTLPEHLGWFEQLDTQTD